MYGSTGPPRKYSTPRGVDNTVSVKRTCQKCGSKEHWTFECKAEGKTSGKATTRLSRSQQLRWGVKQKRHEFVPEPTEWEAYVERVKGVERQMVAEARSEADRKKRRTEKEQRDEVGDGKEEPGAGPPEAKKTTVDDADEVKDCNDIPSGSPSA
uniref:Zinc knuckle n=1 Tax=Trypanosoma congolense (strain IL3000) TaxID=1068625 RepID=G0UKN5_TRYCI|nr:conserved hypothetical protein [Trypanosoma congolense IL3000]